MHGHTVATTDKAFSKRPTHIFNERYIIGSMNTLCLHFAYQFTSVVLSFMLLISRLGYSAAVKHTRIEMGVGGLKYSDFYVTLFIV